MNTASIYRINAPHVVHEVFDDGEAAIINLKSGAYYSLNPVGARIWALMDRRCTLGEIVERLMQGYDGSLVQVIDDVNALVGRLLADELVVPAADDEPPAADGAPEPAPATRTPYTAPVLERFEDMKELLLLDPIHEVGETGWPHARSDEP